MSLLDLQAFNKVKTILMRRRGR